MGLPEIGVVQRGYHFRGRPGRPRNPAARRAMGSSPRSLWFVLARKKRHPAVAFSLMYIATNGRTPSLAAGTFIGAIGFGHQPALAQQRLDLGIVADEIAEQDHGILAAAA